MKHFIFFALLLTGCVTAPLAVPQSAGFGVLAVSADKSGYIISQAKRDDLVKRGVPSNFFTPSGSNWYLSAEYASQAGAILSTSRNP